MVVTARQIDSPQAQPKPASVDPVLIGAFEPISLNELGSGNIQNRIDTKYLLCATELSSLLEALVEDYRVLDIAGVRLHGYQTLYFDTPDFALYHAQHAGRPERFKIRSRRYVETQQSFLEVKQKNRKARTLKNRVATGTLLVELDQASVAFVAAHVPFSTAGLEPKLWNRYARITLASRTTLERVTFDINIGFGEEMITTDFPGLVIAELKQDAIDRSSGFWRQMRLRNIHETGFSKYCIGAAVLNSNLKHNRFKPELLRAQRISERYLNS